MGSEKGLGAPGHTKRGRGLTAAIPSSGEGEGRVKQSAERRRGARRQPGYWKPRWAGSDWDGCGESSGHPQHSALLAASTVTLGCSLALPRPPQCHLPTQGQQGPHVANSWRRQPWESSARGAGKGLLGVKPGEFGTAERKSRPVRELGTEPPARSPAAPRWQWPTVPGPHSILSGQGLRGQPRHGGCAGDRGGFARTTRPSHRGKKCKIMRSHPRLSSCAPLEGNLAHTSPRQPAKSCWERGFARRLETPRSL